MDSKYTVLARKYRSGDFKSLIGQDVLVKTLTTAIQTGRIAHGYVLTGIRGTGKTSTARILAKALNCLSNNTPSSNPCDECDNCKTIAAGQHIDVIEIDAASHTGVDNMRDVLAGVQYRPTNARYKVYIIDEVHMLTAQAFNALLKTLEEPPHHVIFVLATTEIRKIPVTILSRCQRFDLARVSVDTLKEHFAKIANMENITLTDAANEMIAIAADGSVRDGLSLLDQAIAQTGGNVDEQSVMDMLKRADRNIVMNLMEYILSNDIDGAVNLVDSAYNAGIDLSMLLSDMMEWTHWATRMHNALKIENAKSAPYSEEQKQKIINIGKQVSLNTLSRIWQVLIAAAPEMNAAGNQKQCFDMLIIRLIHIADMPSLKEILKNSESEKPIIKPAPVKTETVTNDLTSVMEIGDALNKTKEIMLYSYFNDNVEISEISGTHIKYFDRRGDKDFYTKFSNWLRGYTGKDWTLEKMDESNNVQTIKEIKTTELESDSAIADAMSLFGTTSSDIEKI